MKIVSLLDADQRQQEAAIGARLAQEIALVAGEFGARLEQEIALVTQELARLRERVGKLEEGVVPDLSAEKVS